MCGIAGIVRLTPQAPPVAVAELRAMADQLAHRGPDDEGIYVDPQGRCGLGFRRLSIIDVAGGHQPIANEDGTVQVIFNGEIYNFRALREALRRRGHTFRTRADSEVIVHLYEEHGQACFERLAGMFAIAIWDAARGRLVLARDRFGKKPLTYAVLDGRLVFASEAKAILALPGVRPALDAQSLHRYLIFQYVPAPHSIYRGFAKLPPGSLVTVEGGAVSPVQRYADLPRPARFAGSYADARARLGEVLTAAVERRLIADVPLGAFLSGGVDSSIVVGLMRRLGVAPLRTFSIGFAEDRYDETAWARRVAAHFATEHHEQRVTPRAREILDVLAWHYDEPFADSSAIPTWYVARHARQRVTVALTGDAGDEGFLGYDRYVAARLAARFDRLPGWTRAALARLVERLPRGESKSARHRLYRFAAALPAGGARRYLAWVNIFPPAELLRAYRPEFAQRLDFDEPLRWFERLHDGFGGSAPERANLADFQSYLPYDLLTKVDIASMAHGLECRCPLLDPEVVEFALSLPVEWRLGRRGGKRILKDWARDLLPGEVLTRPKMGFGVPVGRWFRNELRDVLTDRVRDPAGLCARVFRPAWLDALVESHVSGRADRAHPLWALLMLELWYRRWQPAGF